MSEQTIIQEDEITLKELILKVKEFWKELWKYWWLIAIIALPFVIYMGYKAYKSEIIYPANLTFMVNKDEGGALSSFSGILGSFGLGAGTASGDFNLDKMLQLLKSRKITEEVIFTKATIDGTTDYLANHLINHFDTLKLWSKEPSILNRKEDKLKGFKFTNVSVQDFTILENAATKRIHGKLIGTEKTKGLLSSSYDENSGILSINVNSQHEDLSILLTQNYFEKLSKFYTDKTIEKQKVTYDLVKSKSDSIYNLLSSSEYQLAVLNESSRGVFGEKEQLKTQRLNREIQKLTLMYGETAKNVEIADFSLKSKTPFVQIIDTPISPIKPEKKSTLLSLIIGGVLGVFVGTFFIIARKIYRDTMA